MAEKKLDYYKFAEHDYIYLKKSYTRGDVGNAMTYIAQSVCERYLKSVIEYTKRTDLCTNDEMKTHSLRKLKKFITKNIPEFSCDWNKVLAADGFYFSARYPGEDAFFADQSDVDECWAAVCEVKQSVEKLHHKNFNKSILDSDIEKFSNIFENLDSENSVSDKDIDIEEDTEQDR